jgi:hypothetical protein
MLLQGCLYVLSPTREETSLAGNKKLHDSSRLDVEIARVPDMLPSLYSFMVGLRTYQHPGRMKKMFKAKIVEQIETQIFLFFRTLCRL